jgi:hypothetical protein
MIAAVARVPQIRVVTVQVAMKTGMRMRQVSHADTIAAAAALPEALSGCLASERRGEPDMEQLLCLLASSFRPLRAAARVPPLLPACVERRWPRSLSTRR